MQRNQYKSTEVKIKVINKPSPSESNKSRTNQQNPKPIVPLDTHH